MNEVSEGKIIEVNNQFWVQGLNTEHEQMIPVAFRFDLSLLFDW